MRLFADKIGKPLVISNWAQRCTQIKPVVDVYGVEGTQQLQEQFFASAMGWWVEKGQYGIGEFVAAVNTLAGQGVPVPAGHRLSPAMRRNVSAAQAAAAALAEREQRGK
jgi:hypothetical protein